MRYIGVRSSNGQLLLLLGTVRTCVHVQIVVIACVGFIPIRIRAAFAKMMKMKKDRSCIHMALNAPDLFESLHSEFVSLLCKQL